MNNHSATQETAHYPNFVNYHPKVTKVERYIIDST